MKHDPRADVLEQPFVATGSRSPVWCGPRSVVRKQEDTQLFFDVTLIVVPHVVSTRVLPHRVLLRMYTGTEPYRTELALGYIRR